MIPATLMVTANNQSKAFGAAVPALTATITGFVNGQTLATSGVTGQAACSTTATTSSPGELPITCSIGTLAARNYTFSFVPGTLTVTFATTLVCDHIGAVVVTAGESVLIPPGCVQLGNVSVQTGGALETQGAIVLGAISYSSGAQLQVCSTALGGILTATLWQGAVVIGNGTSDCLGSAIVGVVSLTSNTDGVSVQGCAGIGAVSVTSNSGGVNVSDCSFLGAVEVKQNSGGATVKLNLGIVGVPYGDRQHRHRRGPAQQRDRVRDPPVARSRLGGFLRAPSRRSARRRRCSRARGRGR